MKSKRFLKKCEEFSICVNIGEKDYVLAEHNSKSNTIFYYGVYGIGKLGHMFESDYTIIKGGDFIDVKDSVYKDRIFHSQEDFYLIGFNSLNKEDQWEGRLIKEEVIKVDKKSYLICFDGDPVVNDKTLKRFDYGVIEPNKEYYTTLKEKDVIGLFTRLD